MNKLVRCFKDDPKDCFPKQLKIGWCIINLKYKNDGNGTHWVAFKHKNNEIDYFDVFGFSPHIEIMKKAKSKRVKCCCSIHIKKYKIIMQCLVDGFVLMISLVMIVKEVILIIF